MVARILSMSVEQYRPPITIKEAYAIAEARIESLKEAGVIRRVAEISDEFEQDDHFDDLARVYQSTFRQLGLAWPPVEEGEI